MSRQLAGGARPRLHVAVIPAVWLIAVLANPCRGEAADDADLLPGQFRKLLPLHKKLDPPHSSDWLAQHSEPGQTFRQYRLQNPVRATDSRRVIYVQPLGQFTSSERSIIDKTARFLSLYYQLPVRTREELSLDSVPKTARRKAGPDGEQILTTYLLGDVLKPRLPEDAVALIGFTDADLWPGEGWSYVFGQASLSDRVGVWSMNRFGESNRDGESYRRCLRRTLKTASHELGHMFSMAHCTLYDCNMCGCNHLQESDRRPLEMCPHCLAKLCYATGANPMNRWKALIDFYRRHGLSEERQFCEESLRLAGQR